VDSVTVEIGRVGVRIESADREFCKLLRERYDGFLNPANSRPSASLHVDCVPADSAIGDPEDELEVVCSGKTWNFRRGDFRARWNSESGTGEVLQSLNPYALDSVLRILHSVMLAPRGGFLLHAASAVKNGTGFVFSGVSGAGKTTISSLAPTDVRLLSDEVSYIVPAESGFLAYGTPFCGELARNGENTFAPLKCVYLLAHGAGNRVSKIAAPEAVRLLMRNVLFFAQDESLVRQVFIAVNRLVDAVPVRRLEFLPDSRVWEMIQ
jgi:hypothetical protein